MNILDNVPLPADESSVLSGEKLCARYEAAAKSDNPMVRAVAERQLARVKKCFGPERSQKSTGGSSHTSTGPKPSKWNHVPLTELFEQQGNHLFPRRGGELYECGHEPVHGSKTGRCVLVDPNIGSWWCRSCRQRGDAATFVMALFGWSYPQAAQWLAQRYGSPSSIRCSRS